MKWQKRLSDNVWTQADLHLWAFGADQDDGRMTGYLPTERVDGTQPVETHLWSYSINFQSYIWPSANYTAQTYFKTQSVNPGIKT